MSELDYKSRPTETQLVDVEGARFAEAFGRRPLAVRHSLPGHPLLAMDALAELADSLPSRAIERHEADQPLVRPGGAPELEGPPSETVRGIESNGCWMVLWNIEQAPEYRELLNSCVDDAERHLAANGGSRRREAFLFLSAPGAVTPVHFDPEHNLLLQVKGVKEINVGRFADPADQLRELDRYHDGGHRNLDRMPEEFECFRMAPGDGVYVYPWAPHWVKNGPEASISLSITFRTAQSDRAEHVHALNAHLRRLGLKPRPPGVSSAIDRAKGGVVEAVRRLRSGRQQGPHISR